MQCLNCVPAIAGNVVNCRRKHTGPEPARKSAPLNISSTMRIRLLAQNIPASIVFIALIEIVLLVLSLYGAALVRFHQSVSGIERFAGPLLPRALTFGAIVFACKLALGLHSARQRARSAGIFVRIVAAIGMGVLLTGVCFFLIPSLWIGRGVVALAGLGAALIALLLHVVFAHFIDDQVFKIRVLVYGVGRAAGTISGLRRRTDRRAFKVVGYVRPQGEGLEEICRRFDVDEIVVALDDRRRVFPIRELLECRLAGVDVTELLTFLERESGRVRIDVLNPSWIIFGEGFRRGSLRQLTGRALDVIAGSVIMLLSIPAMLLTAIAIKLEDGLRASVFYRQERVGLGGRSFSLMKFRSMHVDAEASGEARWAQRNDPRVTRVG